jgi:hypothetical protein
MVKTIFNQNDDRFALVKWKNEEKYNVVSMNDVEILNSESTEYILQSDYKVRLKPENSVKYNKYTATILLI